MTRHVVVIGAGIVGSALARELSRLGGTRVSLVDSAPVGSFRGSTGHAPGYVGLYNDLAVLTELATASASIYDQAPEGFRRAGGLEVAITDDGAQVLRARAAAAMAAGLPAREVSTAEVLSLAPGLVDPDQMVTAIHYARDGVAEARALTAYLRRGAEAGGASVLAGRPVTGLRPTATGLDVEVGGSVIGADDVVLAGGIWGPGLAALLGLETPLFPVAHPYVFSGSAPDRLEGAFVRWPERHVYARVHGQRIGVGSYDHQAIAVSQDEIEVSAELDWRHGFDEVIQAAVDLLPRDARSTPQARLNGVFSMTPDNLPLLGPHADVAGLWSAQAIWVTHAAGAAALLAGNMIDGTPLPAELAPDRHAATPLAELKDRALRLYRDIYANDVG
jgi:glycine/D-amino acid oxidase-like deaminating enzyme